MQAQRVFNHDMLEVLVDAADGLGYFRPNPTSDERMGFRGGALCFSNGYLLSVQYGDHNYCDGGVTTAETAIFTPEGEFLRLPGDCDDVQGWQTWEDVCALAAVVAER